MDLFKKLLTQHVTPTVTSASDKLEAATAATRYGFPARDMRLIALAGAQTEWPARYCQRILEAAGFKVATVSLAALNEDQYRPWWLHEQLAKLRDEAFDTAILEVNAASVTRLPLHGLSFEAAVLIDGAGELDVAAAKLLVERAQDVCVLHVESLQFNSLERVSAADVQSYGEGDLADVQLLSHEKRAKGLAFTVSTDGEQTECTIASSKPEALQGALAAMTLGRWYDVGNATMSQALL